MARILRGWPFPTTGNLPDPGIEPRSPALAGRFFTSVSPGKPPSEWRDWFFTENPGPAPGPPVVTGCSGQERCVPHLCSGVLVSVVTQAGPAHPRWGRPFMPDEGWPGGSRNEPAFGTGPHLTRVTPPQPSTLEGKRASQEIFLVSSRCNSAGSYLFSLSVPEL